MPRVRKYDPDREKTLKQNLDAAKRALALEIQRGRDQKRADDARRKIIAGALALEDMAKSPDSDFGKKLFRLLDEYVRFEDRHLFEFLPKRDPVTPIPLHPKNENGAANAAS
jgi:hypothetical protein